MYGFIDLVLLSRVCFFFRLSGRQQFLLHFLSPLFPCRGKVRDGNVCVRETGPKTLISNVKELGLNVVLELVQKTLRKECLGLFFIFSGLGQNNIIK